jgi:hypothetical protein
MPNHDISHHSNTKLQPARTWRRHSLFIRLMLTLLSMIGIALWITFLTPSHILFVFPFIILCSYFVYMTTGFINRRLQIYSTLFVFFLLIINYIVGFDLLNTVLLLSFIIGLSLLFK